MLGKLRLLRTMQPTHKKDIKIPAIIPTENPLLLAHHSQQLHHHILYAIESPTITNHTKQQKEARASRSQDPALRELLHYYRLPLQELPLIRPPNQH